MIKKAKLVLIMFILMYITSIIYIPIEIAGSSIFNKICPIVFFILITIIMTNNIKYKYIKKFVILYLFIVFIFVSATRSFISLIYTINISILLLYIVLLYSAVRSFGLEFLIKFMKFIYLFSIIVVFIAFIEYFFPDLVRNLFFIRGSIYSGKGHMSSVYSNPNVYGLITTFSLAIGFIVYPKNIKLFVVSLFIISGVLISGSRMSLAASLAVLMLNYVRIPLSSFKFTTIAVMLLVIMSICYNDLLSVIDLNLRNIVWEGTVKAFNTYPLFGLGLGQYQYEISKFTSISIKQSPNNMFFGFISEVGIFASILFLGFIFSVIKNRYKIKLSNYCKGVDYRLGILMFFLIITQFTEYLIIYVPPYILILSITMIYINQNNKSII